MCAWVWVLITSNRSTPRAHRLGTECVSASGGHAGKASFQSGKAIACGHKSLPGVPNNLINHPVNEIQYNQIYNDLKILKIWSISQSPGKSGAFRTNSAKVAPTDHISVDRFSRVQPRRTSGAWYHRMATLTVMCWIGGTNVRACPKPPTFNCPLDDTIKTLGLRFLIALNDAMR